MGQGGAGAVGSTAMVGVGVCLDKRWRRISVGEGYSQRMGDVAMSHHADTDFDQFLIMTATRTGPGAVAL